MRRIKNKNIDIEEAPQPKPFEFIRKIDPYHVVNFIQDEHPQTIALVLACIEPSKASIILQNLPYKIQSDVTHRIAVMGHVSQDVIRNVECVLEKKLSTFSNENYFAAGGVDGIIEILKLYNHDQKKFTIETLEDEDLELAEEIKKRMSANVFKKIFGSSLFIWRLKYKWRLRNKHKKSKIDSSVTDSSKSEVPESSQDTNKNEKPKDLKKKSYTLSPDEIDQLLAAINTSDKDSKSFKPVIGSRKIKIYDFGHPDKLSKEQIRTVSIIHETFSRLIVENLSVQLRSVVQVHVASVDQLTYEEFIRSVPIPTTLAIINMDALKSYALLEISPETTFSIISRLFGGFEENTNIQRELTGIEKSVMESIIVKFLKNLREAWKEIIDINPRLEQIETNPQFVEIVSPTEMVVLITIEIKIGDLEGTINIAYPDFTFNEVMGKLSNGFHPGKKNIQTKKNLIHGEDIPVTLTAEVLRRDYSINEILKWKKETILLPLHLLIPGCCFLRLGDRRVWQCKILENKKCFLRQIQIVGFAEQPFGTEGKKMETNEINQTLADAMSKTRILISVELGTTYHSMKETLAIGEGTTIELDKLAGEPLDVKANGILIAKGEPVVIDENFGVRIIEIVGDAAVKSEDKAEEVNETNGE